MERRVRWAGWIFLVWAVLLVPWTVYLAAQLPRRALAHNYDVAWAGFDLGMVLVLGAAAIAAFRANRGEILPDRSRQPPPSLLLVDAWFDVMTSPPRDRAVAIAMAATRRDPDGGRLRLAGPTRRPGTSCLSIPVARAFGPSARRRAG